MSDQSSGDHLQAAQDREDAAKDRADAKFDREQNAASRRSLDALKPKGQRGWRDVVVLVLAVAVGFGIRGLATSPNAQAPTTTIAKPAATRTMDLYSFQGVKSVTPAMVAALPAHVNGVSGTVGWDTIQPTNASTYDWSSIDKLFAAVGTRKHVYLRITAGMHAPSWVPTVLIPGQYFQTGTALREPNPADPVFLREWTTFIQAFATRYGSNPQLAQVSAAGGAHQGEMVFNEARWPGWATTSPPLNAVNHEQSWKTIIAAYRADFPANVAITLGVDPEPWAGHTMVADIVAWAHTTYGAGLRLQQNGLKSTTSLTGQLSTILKNASAYTQVGWQEFLGAGASGPLSACLKIAAVFSNYVEVYLTDITPANAATIAQYGAL